jgi:16S rRNA processing protein RimM
MRLEDCFQLGTLGKPHGLQGNVNAYLDADDPYQYQEMESVFVLQRGQLVPFFISGININGNKAIVSFEEINSVEAAAELTGSELYLPLSVLPELEKDQFYYHQIIGYTVIDKLAGDIGKVVQVVNGAQDLLVIENASEEVIVPLHDDLVKVVDKEGEQLQVELPDGLLEIYRATETPKPDDGDED